MRYNKTLVQALCCDRHRAHVAQLVEHTLGKGVAMGSSPIVGSAPNLTQTW
jgi:hypothetical protein